MVRDSAVLGSGLVLDVAWIGTPGRGTTSFKTLPLLFLV